MTELYEGVSNATLTAYIQDSCAGSRPAVIICPGGAYLGFTEKEAEPAALRFLPEGYNAFVLRYSIGAGMAGFPSPFIDVAKAIMLVRQNAERWCINGERVSLCGFSAGGHAAATFAATWQEDYLARALNAGNELFKPNALVLGYPLLNMQRFISKNMQRNKEMQPLLEMMLSAVAGNSNPDDELLRQWNCTDRISSTMPPTFLWMTSEDTLVDVEEGLDFIKALALNNIPYEFHVFQKGAHGLALGDREEGGNAHEWVRLALNWLKCQA